MSLLFCSHFLRLSKTSLSIRTLNLQNIGLINTNLLPNPPIYSLTLMSLKTSKRRMRNGFMCHSKASTAVSTCTSDLESVIVPGIRCRRHKRSVSLDDTRLINYAKYSKLVESSRFSSGQKKCDSVSVPNIKHQENESRELQQMPTDNVFQVVVMRVAIHCQGCAGKVKRHLSKMEGVTSFSVDVESKRVTVMGHISPVGVLESVSKVKRAEFWDC